MGRPRRTECKECGRPVDVCGPLSSRYLCEDCGLERFRQNMDAMILTSGAGSDKWRRGMTDYARALIDALEG